MADRRLLVAGLVVALAAVLVLLLEQSADVQEQLPGAARLSQRSAVPRVGEPSEKGAAPTDDGGSQQRVLVGVAETHQILVVNQRREVVAGALLREEAGEVVASSNAQGVFECAWERIVGRLLVVSHVDYATVQVEAKSPEELEQIVLADAAYLELNTMDAHGAAVAGVEIVVTQQPVVAASSSAVPQTVYSDASGRVRVEGLYPGAFRLAARADGYLVTDYNVAGALPAIGTIVLKRPVVAFGRCRDALDAVTGKLSKSLLHAGLTPGGIVQGEVARFASDLRGGDPRVVAFALAADPRDLPADSGLEVSFLSRGVWGTVTIPFREYAEDLEPVVFGSDEELRGERVAIEVKAKDGRTLGAADYQIAIRETSSAGRFGGIDLLGSTPSIRLPRGGYEWMSTSKAVWLALPKQGFTVGRDAADSDVRSLVVAMEKHLVAARFRVLWPFARGEPRLLDAGSITIRHESGHTDVRYCAAGGLPDERVMLCEGESEVVLTDLQGSSKRLRVRVTESGEKVVDEHGVLTDF